MQIDDDDDIDESNFDVSEIDDNNEDMRENLSVL
jgi:hypothetical protein